MRKKYRNKVFLILAMIVGGVCIMHSFLNHQASERKKIKNNHTAERFEKKTEIKSSISSVRSDYEGLEGGRAANSLIAEMVGLSEPYQFANPEIVVFSDVSSRLSFARELERIMAENGEGSVRSSIIRQLFYTSNISMVDGLSFLDVLGDVDSSVAVGALVERFKENTAFSLNDVRGFDLDELLNSPFEGKLKFLAEGLHEFVGRFGISSGEVKDLVSSAVYEDVFSVLLGSDVLNVSFQKERLKLFGSLARHGSSLQMINVLNEKAPQVLNEPVFQREAFSRWTGKDSQVVANYINLFTSVDFEAGSRFAKSLIGLDLSKAERKYEDLLLSGRSDIEWFAVELAKKHASKGRFSEVDRYLGDMFDLEDERKNRVMSEIWGEKVKYVESRVLADGVSAISSIVNGRSGGDVEMIEVAMSKWIKESPEDSANWFENQGVNVVPEKRQYIAAAYAKEAASQGDVALARQWADLIIDQETAARIQGVIAEAEKAGQN
ncbi:hypothetical protein [Roseibacillus ishigakijimensis]|uniref:Uncharacterized protein n=1 Tax=Roseibacillus ishigakijimensis TaxID=454146 RepID=A0A934VNU2_9BACT|nr:hypothetical protein [Roseibacillus ishigakijimensis]MBK1835682.1 hypothetical protein [Roseibacillus ishigakijimensis]